MHLRGSVDAAGLEGPLKLAHQNAWTTVSRTSCLEFHPPRRLCHWPFLWSKESGHDNDDDGHPCRLLFLVTTTQNAIKNRLHGTLRVTGPLSVKQTIETIHAGR